MAWAQTQFSMRLVVSRSILFFSLCGPIGLTLGLLVRRSAPPLLPSLLLSLVAGTFLYAGATEVVPEEFEEGAEGCGAKAAALIAGAATILVVTANSE